MKHAAQGHLVSRTSRDILKPNLRSDAGGLEAGKDMQRAERREEARQRRHRALTTLRRKDKEDLEAAYK